MSAPNSLISPSPGKAGRRLKAAPTADATNGKTRPVELKPSDNMGTPNSGLVDLNFKVPRELHRTFKITAAEREISMKEILEAAFLCYLEEYPLKPARSSDPGGLS